jgi:CpeT protein
MATDLDSNLLTLARWMAGDFSNAKQAAADPKSFAHIHVFFRPLPYDFFNAIGFYSEQAYDYDLWTPYRQGVHRCVDQGDRIYIENYSLTDAMLYAGAARERSILQTITPQCIQRRHHCSMVFERQGNSFHGQVEGNQCLIQRDGKPTYLVSEVDVTEQTWASLDRGMDLETHEQLWGSTYGPLRFDKVASFADEVPLIP